MSGHIIQLGDLLTRVGLDRIGGPDNADLRQKEDGTVEVWTIEWVFTPEDVERIMLERRAQAAYDAVMRGESE